MDQLQRKEVLDTLDKLIEKYEKEIENCSEAEHGVYTGIKVGIEIAKIYLEGI